ncbi:MAG: hypothetical protein HZC28_13100 [Spirochaetes bacterium]|nr:hypothetical protein [Spirochaetota bacterium]
MCIAADVEKTVPGHPEADFGRTLTETGRLGVGPSVDAAVDGDFLYVIGDGNFSIADIRDPVKPAVTATLKGFGNTRQIDVANGIAYVTSREDGMFLIDVKNPAAPSVVSHYDTIELATGISVSGNVAFVSCRNYGVELVDVSDPANPRHLSTVRTGEAQSAVARDGILYVGVWGTRELVICDVKDARRPFIIAKAPLDGFGDGVVVRGKYCYVATGHHAKGMKKNDVSDPAFGNGHGLEIFDITDPSRPVFVSRIKMPRFYALGMDMWDVDIAGNYAFVADTFNGMFIVDISDPQNPRFVAHRQLDYAEKKKQFSYVGGFAVGRDYIYVAGGFTDLHVLAAPETAKQTLREKGTAPVITPVRKETNPRFTCYKPDGQVYAAAVSGDMIFVAAGNAGVHVLNAADGYKKTASFPTKGFAVDVKVSGDLVYTAESKGGLTISKWENGALQPVGQYRDPQYPVKQVVIAVPGKYVLLHVGGVNIHVVDVSDPSKPVLAFKDKQLGLLYGYQIADGLFENRWALCFWHVSGLHWYDITGGAKPVYAGNMALRMNPADGAFFIEGGALVTSKGGYFIVRHGDTKDPDTRYSVPGQPFSGKPVVSGNDLYISDRTLGKVCRLDISDLEKPRMIETIELEGNPGIVLVHKGKLIIPAGYQGLLVMK